MKGTISPVTCFCEGQFLSQEMTGCHLYPQKLYIRTPNDHFQFINMTLCKAFMPFLKYILTCLWPKYEYIAASLEKQDK